jgi:hypothetical protein
MSAATLEAIRGLIRSELRRCGLRPPMPDNLGAYRWDGNRDQWIPLLGAHADVTP